MAKAKYSDGTEAMVVFNKMIQQYHSELKDAKMVIVFNDAPWNKNGLPVFGELKKMSPLITKVTEIDFIGVINHSFWLSLSEDKREAMVDHLLCGYTSADDKEGNPQFIKVNPNIVEFSNIISRYGAYTSELEEAKVAFAKSNKKGE